MPQRYKTPIPSRHAFGETLKWARLTKRSKAGDYDLNFGSRNVVRVFKTKEGGRTWTLFLKNENVLKKGFKTREQALDYYKKRK